MYRRYAPNPNQRQSRMPIKSQPMPAPHNHSKTTPMQQPHNHSKTAPMPAIHHYGKPMPMQEQRTELHKKEAFQKEKREPKPKSFIFGMVPTSVYNPDTKKVLGMFSAEDLLLVGLIFLLLENEENNDPMLVYALLYILLSDYIDLSF